MSHALRSGEAGIEGVGRETCQDGQEWRFRRQADILAIVVARAGALGGGPVEVRGQHTVSEGFDAGLRDVEGASRDGASAENGRATDRLQFSSNTVSKSMQPRMATGDYARMENGQASELRLLRGKKRLPLW